MRNSVERWHEESGQWWPICHGCGVLKTDEGPCWDCTAPYVDVSRIVEYGLDQKLSNSIRVF